MLGPEFWSQVHAPGQERGSRPCSIHQERRVPSPAADGTPWNGPLPLRPCSPLALSRHLACRIRCLKENCPCDKKLRALKKMILAQRRKCVPHLPGKNSPSFPLEGESRSAKPLKRKVCKAGAFSAPACPGHSERTGKKLRTGQNSASSSRKAEKERAVSLFGVSAWREGQKLARNVLGPPLKYQNLKTELKSKGMEPLQESQGDPFTASRSDRSFRENGQAVQPEMMKKTKQERHAAQLNHQWQDWMNPGWTQKWTRRRQKAPDTEKKNGNHPRSAGRARKAGPTKGSSDGLKTMPSPTIPNASAKMMGMRETSRPGKGRRNGSSLRSETPRKELQPTTTLVEARKKPYSPEQLREFMDQKAAERNRRIREERKTSKQAQEERNKKLQEVYRKQREAAGRRRHCAEQLREDLTSITPTKNHLDLKYPGVQSPSTDAPKGVHRATWTPLRKELKFNSELEPRMDKTGQGTSMLGLSTSMDPESQLRSPLKLKQLDISSSWASHHSSSSFHLWREKVIGRETPFSSDISTSPSYRRKQDRVKAIHNLAKDLSERLGREMERLQATKASRDQGCPPGTPSKMTTPPGVPLEKFDAPENAESIWDSRPALNPPICPPERAGLEKELGVPMVTQHLLPTDGGGLEVMPMDSVERRQSGTEAKDLKEGLASEMGFGEKGPTGAPASVFPGSGSIQTLVEIPKASLKKNQPGGSNRQNKPPENPPGQGGLPFTAQHQPSGFPFPSINLPPGKASAAEDLSEPTDSNSQWSEIGQFYGGASSFGRLSLTLVEQSLREEELRARHQSALLRLREKALREKAQAELAWLEHGERSPNGLQGTGGPSSTAEKQLSILTRLKQEQAEIRHLQNIGRAAHQERKLLLQQQKELLEVQKTTTQLWLQLAGQLPHQISENYNPERVGALEKEKLETSFQTGPLLATCSGGTERRRSSHEAEKKHLAESKDSLPPENQAAEGFAKWKPGKGDPSTVLETTMQDLYDPSGQRSQDPALGDGRTAEWEPAIRIGVLDCGDEKNYEQCKEYGIQYYPTFRYFKAFTKQFTVGENHHATSDRDLQTIRQTMIDFLQNHSREAKPPACPSLEPTLPEEVFSLLNKHSQHYTAIIFESGSSYLGREVILDLGQYEKIAIKRVLNSEATLLEKLGITSVPSLYLVYPNGSHGLINNLKPLRSFFSSHLKSLPGVKRKLTSPLPLLQQKRPGNTSIKEWKEFDQSKLYMADLESGLHYLFRVELATHKTLEGAELRTLKDVVILLAKLFPGRQPVMKSLETLQVWLLSLPLDRIPYDAILDLLNNKMHISGLFLPSRLQWVGCQGSQVGLRGYTCSFWKLFHTLTVQAAAQPRALLNTGFEDNPRVVLQTMQRYVQDFFGCRACAEHFGEMARASLDSVKSWDEAVLWLWEKHNVVNARLAGDLSEDPQFPKVRWPTLALCPACHKGTQGPSAWDKTQVLQFLKQHYGSHNLDHTYLKEADNAEEEEAQGGGEAFPEEAAQEANKGQDPQKSFGSKSKGLDPMIAKEDSVIDPGKRPGGSVVEQERKQAVSFLGVGFSNIDMSLCIVLYVASSLFLMIMFFFFRVRSKRWKVRHNRPYV